MSIVEYVYIFFMRKNIVLEENNTSQALQTYWNSNLIIIYILCKRFSAIRIVQGLPVGCFPVENSPGIEIDESLITHIGPEHLTTVERQCWILGMYERGTKRTISRVVGNDRSMNTLR